MKHTFPVVVALALAVSACGQQEAPEEDDVPTPYGLPDDSTSGNGADGRAGAADEVHVLNLHGDEEGFDDQRPENYVATASTTFSGMDWREWSQTRARGGGDLLGTWCMDQNCQDDPYDVEIELGDPVEVDGTWYFSTYRVTGHEDMPDEQRQALEQADGGRLNLPAPAE